jgi:superfamily II DNA or RNA helicase
VSGLKLRDYQTEAIDAVFKAWADGMKAPAIVLPTGAGKTVVFSELIKRWRLNQECAGPIGLGARVIVLVHRDELADQAIAKIKAVLPNADVGKVKAASNEVDADVVVASVQTLASERRRLQLYESMGNDDQRPFGLIITDECHHAAAESYRKIYGSFPDALRLGVTATLARGDGVGLGDVWEEVVFSRSPLWMIGNGYLCDVKAVRVDVSGLDMADVKKSRGDYQAGDLGRAMMDSHADRVIATAYTEHARDRPGVVFTPTVETAHAAAEELNAAGVRTAVISGETPRQERQQIFADFRSGAVQVLSNCMVLTEGFDAPWASCAVIARPTQSQPLYVQMVGRVLRTWPGKTDALVLDLVGASALKLRTLVDLEPGSVQEVREDETLAEAAEREEREAEQTVPGSAGAGKFKLRNRDVDMFAGSESVWLQTRKGVLFIDAGSKVFLWPSKEHDGLWDVCVAVPDKKWKRTGHTGLDLGMAMAWGEAVADEYGAFSSRKSARWRKSPPSDKQVAAMRRMNQDPAGMTRGDVSDFLSVYLASRIFDRHAN